MWLHIKRFDELTTLELYEILKLRTAVFVVEQNCPYMELDGRDQRALHVWMENVKGITAYLRVLDRGVECEHVAIGRVVVAKRRQGLGSQILKAGIDAARYMLHADKIYLEAQTYARGLYEKQGFRQISEEFLLDGIPHIQMMLDF